MDIMFPVGLWSQFTLSLFSSVLLLEKGASACVDDASGLRAVTEVHIATYCTEYITTCARFQQVTMVTFRERLPTFRERSLRLPEGVLIKCRHTLSCKVEDFMSVLLLSIADGGNNNNGDAAYDPIIECNGPDELQYLNISSRLEPGVWRNQHFLEKKSCITVFL